jgi:hypothetical protein
MIDDFDDFDGPCVVRAHVTRRVALSDFLEDAVRVFSVLEWMSIVIGIVAGFLFLGSMAVVQYGYLPFAAVLFFSPVAFSLFLVGRAFCDWLAWKI